MTSPSSALSRRVVLVPAAPRGGREDAVVRRFRLARMHLEGRRPRPQDQRPAPVR